MADVEMMDCVDDVYEMDCPKFVDFTVPQDMNDNADEWFKMTSHSVCLQQLCRLCGEKRTIVQGRQPIAKEKFSKPILRAFGVDIQDDDRSIHPPFICRLCELKISKWWKKFGLKNMKGAACNISLHSFEAAHCEFCEDVDVPLTSILEGHHVQAAEHGLLPWFAHDRLKIMKMDSVGNPVVDITVFKDLSWKLSVAGVDICDDRFSLSISSPLQVSDCSQLCSIVASRHVCVGNDDFGELIDLKKGPEGQVPTWITPQDMCMRGTVRHKKCQLLIEASGRCDVCKIHRSDLAGVMSRLKSKAGKVVSSSSTIPNKSMTTAQLRQKVDSLQCERRALKRKSMSLQDKIADILQKESVELDVTDDQALKTAVQVDDAEMSELLPINSPARLLWDQQKESLSKGKQMRWHPAIIRWCIALQSKSPAAYNLLRESQFIRLPHPNTLYPYSHFAEATTGFSFSMLERIFNDFNLAACPEEEKNVVVLFDEMKVKSGLVYSVRSGKINGFTDVGEISNEISSFERHCKGDEKPEVASHVLVFMVRGLFSSLHVPVACYATTGVSSDQLYPCVSEVIMYLETAGLKVHALVSDGASPNRKLYRLHGSSSSSLIYHTIHPVDPSRKLYFICDVPHLIKTTRNNWENSGYNSQTKNLCYDKQSITWTQLLRLYEGDVGLARSSPGLRRLHKLNPEHLQLTPAHRMRVYLAAQVLSNSVANAFEMLGRSDTSSVIKFVRYMDQFFDCLNVSRPLQGVRARKPALMPYTSPDDWRFEWLMTDFLGFFKEWEDEINAIPGLDKKTRKRMCLSKETLEGIRITDYDHENGIPLKFDEKDAGVTSEEPSTVQHPLDAPEAPVNAENTPAEELQVQAEGRERSKGEGQVSVGETYVVGLTEPEISEPEEVKTSSQSEDTSTAEMSTDSLESKPAMKVPVDGDTVESANEKPKTRGSPEVAVRKRRGNIVTSFSRREEDGSTSDQSSGPEKKSSNLRSHSRQRSVEVASRPTRKSPRLASRRSADSARQQRRSASQATKRRSANPVFGRPRSGSSTTDQPNNKRRKMGNDESTAGPSDAKKPCPKIKTKINLTLPTTPTLLKRNMTRPNTQVKSTEEIEMEKIAHFRQELAAIRKKAAQSFKTVKESAPVMPVHGEIKPTKPEEFKFETDARLKSHPMETRKDTRRTDFVGNLRKYVPSPSRPHGRTKPKPFNFSDNRKRTHEESFAAEKKGYEFRSVALAVTEFQTRTPDRFRSKPVSEQNKGPEPAVDRPKKPKLTQPMTPALECRNRQRAVTVVSQAQKEEEEIAEMKNYKFRARPVDPRVMSNVGIGVKTANHKEPTKAIGFDLEIEKRLQEREANKVQTEEHYEFRARPVPAKILAGPVGIAEAKPLPLTNAKSPAFALKHRARAYEEKEREKEKETEHDNPHIIKARPILHVGVPFVPNIQHKKTELEPFSFDDKIQESKARKEAKRQEVFREEEKARQFRAQPLPDLNCSGMPEKKVKPPTQVVPFSVADKGAKQAEEWSKKMEHEIKECKRIAGAFKAKPANVLYEEPFVPEKSTKPMTDISNFTLNTERRAGERKEYEQNKYERQCALDAILAQREAEKEQEMHDELSQLRAKTVHKANPIRHFKAVEILPSTKLLTQPESPRFSDRTRSTSHV